MASDQDQRKAMKLIYNEIVQINKKSVYDDEAHISIPDTDNPRVLEVSLTPRSGYYKGGEFKFKITLPDTYPNKPPTVAAITKMYHPNISYSGNVCLNILSGEFDPNYRLEHYINALLWLLLNPNFDSQLNGSVKRDTYAFDVVLAMRGFPVGGTTFEKTLITSDNDNWEPSEDLKKLIFHSLWGGIYQKNPKVTIPEFLKDPATQEWIKFEPGLQKMLGMGLEGTFVQKNNLVYVPQNAILKHAVMTLSSKRILVLTGSYNNGKPSKELVAKFLEAKEEDLNDAPGNLTSLCGMSEDKISIFSYWNKFEHILINDNVFIYETVVVPSWFPNVLFQIKSAVFQNFPEAKVGKFTTQLAGAVVASTSTVDAWYQTLKKTISVEDFLKEPIVKDWIRYDPLALFFAENGITGELTTRESLASVPDDVLAKIALYSAGELVILTICAESEMNQLCPELIAKAVGVAAESVKVASSDTLLGCPVNKIVPFCLPPKINQVLINEDLFKHEQFTLPVGPATYLTTNPAILKLIKSSSIVPLSIPRTDAYFPKKSLFAQWATQVVRQPAQNTFTVSDVLQSQIASKWRTYDITAQYLLELGLLDCKFLGKESERWIPDEVIARQVVWCADGKLVAVVHSEKQGPTTELIAKALGLEQHKVAQLNDTEYQSKVGCTRAAFTILYPTQTITKVLVSETLLQHKFVVVQITSNFVLKIPSKAFTNWKNSQIADICLAKQILRKSVFDEWSTSFGSKSIGEFLKSVHVIEWGANDPTTKMLQELQLDGTWLAASSLSLVPDEVYLKQYVISVDGEPVVVLAAKTPDSVLNKELLAKALEVPMDKVIQADHAWYDSIGVLPASFSIFNPVTKAKILIDDKAMQHKHIVIASGHTPLFQLRSEFLLKLEGISTAALTCAPNHHTIQHIVDAQEYSKLSKKQQRLHERQPKKCLLRNWVDSLKDGSGRANIERLSVHREFFDYEPTVGFLLKLGAQGSFIRRSIDAQRISTRATQCGLPPNQVLKELIWLADGKPVLVLSNGDDPIDYDYLANALGCSAAQLVRPKKNELEALCGLPPQLVSAFSPFLKVDKTVVNQRILELPEVATSAGKPELSLIVKPDVFTRIPNVVIANLVDAQMVEDMKQRREERERAANNNNNAQTPSTNNNNASVLTPTTVEAPTATEPVSEQQTTTTTTTNTNLTS